MDGCRPVVHSAAAYPAAKSPNDPELLYWPVLQQQDYLAADGLTLDLSTMTGVQVDPVAGLAVVEGAVSHTACADACNDAGSAPRVLTALQICHGRRRKWR